MLQARLVVALWDHGDVPLRRPPQEDLRGGLAVLLRDALDGRVVEEQRGVFGFLHVQLEERLRAERRVGGDGDAFALGEMQEAFLGEVRVVFDLQRCGADFGVAEEVHEELAVEVADADAFGETLFLHLLHRRPGLLNASLPGDDVLAIIGEAWWVALGRIDVFERDGEVHDVEVKVVDAPVFELFFADGLYFVAVVEGVPQLGDEEEVFSLYDTVFDGAGDALAGFDFVAVVWRGEKLATDDIMGRLGGLDAPHAPSKRR